MKIFLIEFVSFAVPIVALYLLALTATALF